MTQAYRFLPWTRRGLVATLPAGRPKTRGRASFKVTITEEIFADRTVVLLGPGDVVGIDTRMIVRTDPRPGASNVEPNYLAAIDFDAPDLPWLFTPTGGEEKLKPWVALVVLDADAVPAPRVSTGAPLPWIDIMGGAVEQLPDLEESWAWAHAQRLTTSGDAADAQGLDAAPDLNVSRLVCPRRLDANRAYTACVVPTWEVGRLAGLGLLGDAPPDDDADLEKAWSGGEVRLPVYFHWSFTTGKAGDFEALARRLRPVAVSAAKTSDEEKRLGRIYLGSVDGQADTGRALPPDQAASSIRLDAPLEALDRSEPKIAEVPDAFVAAVDRALSPGDGEELLPPIYGDRHANRKDVDPADLAQWLDELNLDPRTRLAARLGGDVIRKFQEELMHAAWQQVGDVIDANAQLSRSRFLAAVASRMIERHVARLPPDRVLMLTSGLHRRTLLDGLTLPGRIAATSLPDRAFEPALRRLASPVGRAARIAARGVQGGRRVAVNPALCRDFAEALQRHPAIVDPDSGPRDGVGGFEAARRLQAAGWNSFVISGDPDGEIFPVASLARQTTSTLDVTPRDDIAAVGLFGEEHLRVADRVAAATGTSAAEVLAAAAAVIRAEPAAVQIAIRPPARVGEAPRLSAIVLDAGRSFTEIAPDGGRTHLLTVTGDAAQRPFAAEDLAATLRRLPSSTVAQGGFDLRVDRAGSQPRFELEPRLQGGGGGFQIDPRIAIPSDRLGGTGTNLRAGSIVGPQLGVQPPFVPPPVVAPPVVLPPITAQPAPAASQPGGTAPPAGAAAQADDAAMFLDVMPAFDRPVMALVSAAFAAAAVDPAAAPPEPQLIRADLAGPLAQKGLAAMVRQAIDPEIAFRRRLDMLVSLPDWIERKKDAPFDPITAAPAIDAAFADLLAVTAPERLLPAELSVPDDSVVALRTNPRFVAAFMVGANHEMNRELVWRTYPADGRGTSLTRFWNWFDPGKKDVEAIHAWPAVGPLEARLKSGLESHLVALVRGRLLQRYPNTHILLWKADGPGKLAALPQGPGQAGEVLLAPSFKLPIPPDITVTGFDLPIEKFLEGTGWYLVLQEPATEARFGLDDNEVPRPIVKPRNANALDWGTFGVEAGKHLTAAALGAADSAAVAGKLLQQQIRFAIHSSELAPMFPTHPAPH